MNLISKIILNYKNLGMRLFGYLSIIILLSGCNVDNGTNSNDDPVLSEITPIGALDMIEIVTWNIEQFPKTSLTDDYIIQIINGLEADVYLVQEIQNGDTLAIVMDELDNYDYFLLTNSTGLKLGIIYNNNFIKLKSTTAILADSAYYFASRPPLLAKIEWKQSGVVKELSLINVHYKCCGTGTIEFEQNEDGSWDEEYRRLRTSQLLHDYIITNLSDENVIVAGDWNDAIQEPEETNVFQVFIDDSTNFKFADMDIANGKQDNWSWQGWSSSYPAIHFDHILINKNMFDEYQNDSDVSTIKLEKYFENGSSEYDNYVSDHRPVFIKFNP